MAYFVAAFSAWMVLSALTALRPSRRGVFAAFAYPVGWAAGELAVQAILIEGFALVVLWWWGWPRTQALSVVVLVLGSVVVLENFALIVAQFLARRVVRDAMFSSPHRPLVVPAPKDDAFGTWWRTMLQIPFHPRDMQLIKNIAYGPLARHRLDVWRMSTTPTNAPVIFYIHGGAWTFGDKREQGRPMLHELVRRGWIAVSCNYRLAPTDPWPAQIDDVTRTLGWIKKYIANYGGDPERIVVAGGSAGGHLAALLALSADDPSWRPHDVEGVRNWHVRGCISLYGVLEMTGDEAHWHGLGRGLRFLLEQRVVQRAYEEYPEIYRAMSPYHRIDIGAPPFLVVQGRNDTLVDVHVARDFVDEFRRRALAPVYYVELPLTQHAFDVSASPRTSAVVRAVVAFATSVVEERPVPDATLLAAYESPPTELLVDLSESRRVHAREAAKELGPYWVITALNPYSRRLDATTNERRFSELDALLERHRVIRRASVACDPTGEWPDEHGFAVFGVTEAFVRRVAHVFDQFAYYYVDDVAVQVRRTDEFAELGEDHVY